MYYCAGADRTFTEVCPDCTSTLCHPMNYPASDRLVPRNHNGGPALDAGYVFKPAEGAKDTNPKDALGATKVPFSAIPWASVIGTAMAMLEGALKYGRSNYRHPNGVESDGAPKGTSVRASIYFDALLRHMVSFWEGEDVDPDSGLSHLDKAAACIAVLRDAHVNGLLYDDRPPTSKVPELIREMNIKAKAMVEACENPRRPWVRK
jgi:hypothetical protein